MRTTKNSLHLFPSKSQAETIIWHKNFKISAISPFCGGSKQIWILERVDIWGNNDYTMNRKWCYR